jgi:hypothetical protein
LPGFTCAPQAEQKRASLLIEVPQFLQKTAMLHLSFVRVC